MRSLTVLPLHHGRAPRWLFSRMVKLSGRISDVIIEEFGPDELVKRLSSSEWFQALACTIGYDWHSSGVTTVTMGALKEALNKGGEVFIAGGKGKAGTNTPKEIIEGADALSIPNASERFTEFSRLAAKVDGAMVYDGIGIYHHTFVFSKSRKWAVVQQAMHYSSNKAIRFQWFSDFVDAKDIAKEPHSGLETEKRGVALDLTSLDNTWARESAVESLEEYGRVALSSYSDRHRIIPQIDITRRGLEAIKKASEAEPKDYQELLLVRGVGRTTIRSLAFISSLIYDKELAYRDPTAFAYNLGGKDSIPYRINKRTYDSVIEEMDRIVDRANLEREEKYGALKRLASYMTPS